MIGLKRKKIAITIDTLNSNILIKHQLVSSSPVDPVLREYMVMYLYLYVVGI